jgi:hypothetical protein
MVSIREITVSEVSLTEAKKNGGRQVNCVIKYAITDNPGRIAHLRNVRVYSLQGRLNPITRRPLNALGVYIVRIIP